MITPDSVIDPKAKARLRAELDRGDAEAQAAATRRAAELKSADHESAERGRRERAKALEDMKSRQRSAINGGK
jgi:hypothetical protein